jgi:Zn-dependent M28 family amino/carboxypeptidase
MKSKLYRLQLLALIAALSLATLAQQSQRASQVAPDVAQLKEHIAYLASDELEGRKTGTNGANAAAIYIANQFSGYGLDCPSPNWMCHHTSNNHLGYLKEFPFVAAVEIGKATALHFTQGSSRIEPPLAEEWMPLGFSSRGSVSQAQLAFVGYGIKAAELKHDDYAQIDARNRVALAFAGTPDGDNPHGQFARYTDSRWKAVAAKDHGARALILIARAEKFTDDRLARLGYDQTAGEAGLPVAVISRQTAARLFGLSDAAQLNSIEKGASLPAEAARKLQETSLNLSVEIARRTVPAHNVIGILEGSDPQLKREVIVIGAHYDHLGRGGESSRAPDSREVHHGADDNASGVAGLLELARLFAAERKQLRRTLVFIAFSGEESGLIGSHDYVNHPALPLADTVAMLNLDMVGRLKDNKLTIGGVGAAAEFRQLVEAVNASGHSSPPRFALQLNEDGFGPSDHSSFYAKQVPVLFFFTGTHEDYHKPSDTAEKINYEGEARVVAFVADIVRALDRRDQRPSYTLARSAPQMRATGFRIYLGTVPSYAESNDGMVLDGVRDGSPAAKAGLKAGDRIVKLAGREIRNVYDYTYALGEMKAAEGYEVEVVRGGERLKMKIVPQARP